MRSPSSDGASTDPRGPLDTARHRDSLEGHAERQPRLGSFDTKVSKPNKFDKSLSSQPTRGTPRDEIGTRHSTKTMTRSAANSVAKNSGFTVVATVNESMTGAQKKCPCRRRNNVGACGYESINAARRAYVPRACSYRSVLLVLDGTCSASLCSRGCWETHFVRSGILCNACSTLFRFPLKNLDSAVQFSILPSTCRIRHLFPVNS